MPQLLENKRIVIVGGTTGIGLSAMESFINYGARVVSMGITNVEDEHTHSDHGIIMFGDARVEGEVEKAIQQCVDTFEGFDAIYHVAGGSGRKWGDGPLHELTYESWQKTLELNLNTVMLSNRAAIKYFLAKGQKGSILNMSTLLAYRPSPRYFYTHAYATAKSAIIGFSKSIASYYAAHDIRINVLAPGLTDTPMAARAAAHEDIQKFIKTKQPLEGGRMAVPKDMDGAAAFLLSDAAGFITGQTLGVDGGGQSAKVSTDAIEI